MLCGGRVPPRRRRDGYRLGNLSAELRAAIEAEAETLAAIEGSVARIDASSDLLAAVDDAMNAVRNVRLNAVAELRAAGWSYDRIAEASTLSKSRVAQLVEELRDQGDNDRQ